MSTGWPEEGLHLVMCTARWCVACKRYDLDTLKDICTQNDTILHVIDVEDVETGGFEDQLLDKHAVEELPTFLLIEDGHLHARVTGVTHKRPMRSVAKLFSKRTK